MSCILELDIYVSISCEENVGLRYGVTQWIASIVAAKVLCRSASFSRSCIVDSSVSGAPDDIILSQLTLFIPQIFSDN